MKKCRMGTMLRINTRIETIKLAAVKGGSYVFQEKNIMILPRKVKFEAKKKQNENVEFRIFLKCNADETELDQQFWKLHKELFDNYDCNRCRNCCKMYHGSIPQKDVEQDAPKKETEHGRYRPLQIGGFFWNGSKVARLSIPCP